MTVIDAPPQPASPPPPPPRVWSRLTSGGFGQNRSGARTARVAEPASTGMLATRAALLTLSVVMAWFVFYALALTSLQNHHDQGVLWSQFRQQLAEETAPIGGVISPGSPVAIMNAPAAGIKREIVVEGTTSSNLTEGPGHERDTVLPGQQGLSTIMGRARLFGAPFRSIASMPVGAKITFTTAEGVSTYKVLDVRHGGDLGPVPLAQGAGGLQLITSESSGWRSGWAPSDTVYVDAALTSTPLGTSPTPGLSSITKAEKAMQGNPAALYVLVLMLPLLLGAVLATAWAFARWGRWQAWFCGAPVIIGALWAVSKVAIELLPNLT